MSLEILLTTLKRIKFISSYSLFHTISISSFGNAFNCLKRGCYGQMFISEQDPLDVELTQLSSKSSHKDQFFRDLVTQPDTLIIIFISFIIPAFLCLGHLFTYKDSKDANFFTNYFSSYLSIVLATLFVIISLVVIALGSNKFIMGDMADTKACILPLLCGFSYTYIPILISIKFSTFLLLLAYLFNISIFIIIFILTFILIYFSTSSAKISVLIMNALPSMSKDRKHVILVAISVFITLLILAIHIYFNLY